MIETLLSIEWPKPMLNKVAGLCLALDIAFIGLGILGIRLKAKVIKLSLVDFLWAGLLSAGIFSLGMTWLAFWMSNDPGIIREGKYDDLQRISMIFINPSLLAVFGGFGFYIARLIGFTPQTPPHG